MTLALALVFQSWQYNGLTDKNVPQKAVLTLQLLMPVSHSVHI